MSESLGKAVRCVGGGAHLGMGEDSFSCCFLEKSPSSEETPALIAGAAEELAWVAAPGRAPQVRLMDPGPAASTQILDLPDCLSQISGMRTFILPDRCGQREIGHHTSPAVTARQGCCCQLEL